MDTLVIERYAAADEAGFGPTLPLFIERAKKATINGRPAIEDGRNRREIATAFRQQRALAAHRTRTFQALAEGPDPGPAGPIHKLDTHRPRHRDSTPAMALRGTPA